MSADEEAAVGVGPPVEESAGLAPFEAQLRERPRRRAASGGRAPRIARSEVTRAELRRRSATRPRRGPAHTPAPGGADRGRRREGSRGPRVEAGARPKRASPRRPPVAALRGERPRSRGAGDHLPPVRERDADEGGARGAHADEDPPEVRGRKLDHAPRELGDARRAAARVHAGVAAENTPRRHRCACRPPTGAEGRLPEYPRALTHRIAPRTLSRPPAKMNGGFQPFPMATTAELVRKVSEGVEKVLQPPFAALSASVDTATIRIDEIAAKVAQIEARLAALALGGAPRQLNLGKVADDAAPAPARAASRAKKTAGGPPANAMYLFYQQFSTQPDVRASFAATALAQARSIAGIAGEPDEKGWKKVASQIWKTMDAEMKKVWQVKHQALSSAPVAEELGLDAGDGFDEVVLAD